MLDSAGDTEMKLLTKLAAKLIQSKKKLPHQLLKEAEAETQTSWSSEPQLMSAAWSDRLAQPLCRGAAQSLCKAQSPRSERMFADHTTSVMVRFKCSGCECRCNVCKSGTRCGCGCHSIGSASNAVHKGCRLLFLRNPYSSQVC